MKERQLLTEMHPIRKSERARDKMKKLELVRSLLSTVIAQNTNPFPTMEQKEKLPRRT